jgi:drug/metabolite transporter (DMT)-like permease
MRQQSLAYLYAIIAILCWSTVATAFKIALSELTFPHLLLISTFSSAVVLLIVLIFRGELAATFRINLKQTANSALLGFLNPFLYYMVLLWAYSLLPAQIAQPLNYTWPVVLVLLSAPLLGQKINPKVIIALVVCLAGVLFISLQGKTDGIKIEEPLGVILAAGSSLIWAVFWLLNMRDNRKEPGKLFINFLFGFLFTLIYVCITDPPVLPSLKAILSGVYVGVFEMGLTFVLWMKALSLTDRTDRISPLVFISPFVSLLFITFILKESIHFTTVIGLVLIAGGVFMSQRFQKR